MSYIRHNWYPLIILLALLIGLALGARAIFAESAIIVVHTGETRTLHYNPLTHEEVRNEMADGNVMLTVKPKAD